MINRRKLVLVWWLDSLANSGWGKPEPGLNLEILSVGWVVYEDADRIVLSAHSARHSPGDENVCDPMTIPRVAITRMTRVRVPKEVRP